MPAEVRHWFILLLLWKNKKPYDNIYQEQIKRILVSIMTGTVTFAGKGIRVLYGLFLQLLNYFTLAKKEGSLVKGKIEKKKKKKEQWLKRVYLEQLLLGSRGVFSNTGCTASLVRAGWKHSAAPQGAFIEQGARTQVNFGVSSVMGLETALAVKIPVYGTNLTPMDWELWYKSCMHLSQMFAFSAVT